MKQGRVASMPLPVDITIGLGRSPEHTASFGSEGHLDGLPLPSVRNAIGTYPDTGESGDAYDAETFLEADHW